MALIRTPLRNDKSDFDIYDPDIPLVPALELLEQQQRRLSSAEVASVAAALLLLLPNRFDPSVWHLAKRIDSINQRF